MRRKTFKKNRRGGRGRPGGSKTKTASKSPHDESGRSEREIDDFIEAWGKVYIEVTHRDAKDALARIRADENKRRERDDFEDENQEEIKAHRARLDTESQKKAREQRLAMLDTESQKKAREQRWPDPDTTPVVLHANFQRDSRRQWPTRYHYERRNIIRDYLKQKKNPDSEEDA
jgi:hypothetical protein